MIDYHAQRRVLAVTGGHPFAHEPFFNMLKSVPETAWTHVEHPAAAAVFDPRHAEPFDAFLFYDMPGLDFTPGPKGGYTDLQFVDPPAFLKSGLDELLEAGKPLIFMHHALAAWPSWREYAHVTGGRFEYRRDESAGVLDSGYRHGVTHQINVVTSHPITEGLGASFEIEDELYLVDIDERGKVPLLRSDFDFTPSAFYSAHEAVCNDVLFAHFPWHRGHGSNLVGWLHKVKNSTVVYFQCGDGPAAYANPSLRRLLANTVHWVTSTQGRHWRP